MNSVGQEIGESVDSKRRFVRDDCLRSRSHPGRNHLFVWRCGELPESVEASLDSLESARPDMVLDEMTVEAGLLSIRHGKVSPVFGGDFVESFMIMSGHRVIT